MCLISRTYLKQQTQIGYTSQVDQVSLGEEGRADCCLGAVPSLGMAMLKNKTYRRLVIVSLGAFIGSFLGWLGASLSIGELARREFEASAGLERTGSGGYLIQPPYSTLGLVERGVDRNEDGKSDLWSLHALHDTQFFLHFVLYDTNFDGTRDQLEVLLGPEQTKNSYNYSDDNSDGIVDRIWVSFGDTTTIGHHYTYDDLNFDGRIDVISEYQDNQVVQIELIHEHGIYPAQVHDLESRVFWVWTDQKTWELVKLDETGVWIPLKSDNLRPPDSEKQTGTDSQDP